MFARNVSFHLKSNMLTGVVWNAVCRYDKRFRTGCCDGDRAEM